MTKIDVVFADSAGNIKSQIKSLSREFAVSRSSIASAFADFGDLFSGFGLGGEELEDITAKYVKLGLALKASNPTRTMEDIKAALKGLATGETEGVKGLGIKIAAKDYEAFGKNLTTAEKVIIGFNLAMGQSANAFKLVKERQKTLPGQIDRTKTAFANLLLEFGKQITGGKDVIDVFRRIADKLFIFIDYLEKNQTIANWVREAKFKIKEFYETIKPILKAAQLLFQDLFSKDVKVRESAFAELEAKLREIAQTFGEILSDAIVNGTKKAGKAAIKEVISGDKIEQTGKINAAVVEGLTTGLVGESKIGSIISKGMGIAAKSVTLPMMAPIHAVRAAYGIGKNIVAPEASNNVVSLDQETKEAILNTDKTNQVVAANVEVAGQ